LDALPHQTALAQALARGLDGLLHNGLEGHHVVLDLLAARGEVHDPLQFLKHLTRRVNSHHQANVATTHAPEAGAKRSRGPFAGHPQIWQGSPWPAKRRRPDGKRWRRAPSTSAPARTLTTGETRLAALQER